MPQPLTDTHARVEVDARAELMQLFILRVGRIPFGHKDFELVRSEARSEHRANRFYNEISTNARDDDHRNRWWDVAISHAAWGPRDEAGGFADSG